MVSPKISSDIRVLEPADLPQIATLFQCIFRRGAASAPSLVKVLDETYLQHPWFDKELSSKVHVNEAGVIDGFIGVVPVHLELSGRPLRAAFAGSMMVEKPKENPLVGARLLRAFLAGPQDVSLSETANATAMGMWRTLGHGMDPGYSMNWLRVLRPGAAAAAAASHKFPAAALLKPFGRLADGLAGLARFEPFRPDAAGPRGLYFRDVEDGALVEAVRRLGGAFALRPRWDEKTLRWLFDQAASKHMFGPMVRRVAYGPDGAPLACYVYYGRPGGIAFVLQVLGAPARMSATVDDLFRHAYERGCAGVRGSGQPWLTPALMQKKTLFYSRASVVVHSRDAEIVSAIRSGDALITGLGGESWSRLIGDRFN